MKYKRFFLSLLLLLGIAAGARAQYVFVTANPSGSGEVRVAKSIADLGSYQDGTDFIYDAQPGETIYFDFRPYSGWQFTGTVTNDGGLTDITLLENGIYSFTMPGYEETFFINIKIAFEQEVVVAEGVNINADNFPDANFRSWLLAQSYGKDAVITDAEMAGITEISAPGCGIADLTGIGYFTELTELNVGNSVNTTEENKNKITSINLSALTKLRKLWCNDNQITSLDLSQCANLRDLDCSNNQLTELDVTGCPDLITLLCSGNKLSELDVTQNLLIYQLHCDNNQLTSIDVRNHDQMIIFNCDINQLTSLDVTGCTALFQLYCYNNKIKGEGMTTLVSSLETPANGGYMVMIDLESETEENEMTDGQIAAAKAKRWSVEAFIDGGYVSYPYDPDEHQYVDLGLPSGTLWATTNIGATHPYQSGLFFAWGDTEGHGSDVSDGYLFSWENYKWGKVEGEDTWLTKYCTDSSRGKDGFTDGKYILAPEDDAAYVNWGPEWRMPSKEQFDELRSECTWTRMYLGDVYGYDVEGPNGCSIFLPDTGWRIDDMLLGGGAFWSRSSDPEDVGGAYYLGWDANEWEHIAWYEYGGRLDGQCVRPVMNRFTVTIPASGIATFSADCSVIVPEGLTAHYCTTYDSEVGTIGVKAISGVIPAETGVLLCGEQGQSYTLTATDDAAEAISGNALVAVTASTHVAATDGVYTNFMLKSGEFIKIADNTSVMPANKAYLQIATADLGSNARRIALNWAGEATAISGMVDSRPSGSECFDMQGRKVTGRPAHGVYIINGKKSVIR